MDYSDKPEQYVSRLYDILLNANFSQYDKFLKELKELECGEAATILMRGFLRYFRPQKGDYLAVFMEKALRYNSEWSMTDDPNNPLLRTTFISGSKDLYDCYVEVVEGLDKDWFERALQTAALYNRNLLDKCQTIFIGRDYNTGLEQNGRRCIDLDDYAVMDATIVKYNQIIGLRQIMIDLMKKSGRM